MNFATIVNYVKRYTSEYFPDISFREGTAANDLFAKGFAILCRGLLNIVNGFVSTMDPRNYASMTEAAMDRLAALWFLNRRQGGSAYGQVRIYLSSASAVKLPVGFTVLSSAGLKFSTSSIYSFSLSQIQSNREGGRYYFDIMVYAQNTGEKYNISAGGIVDIETSFYLPWESVSNSNAFINGGEKEDNEELYYRIYNSANTRNLIITKGSVESTLLGIFSSIEEMEVLGYGDSGMNRDLVYGVILPEGTPYKRSDFDQKSRGSYLYNKSAAYYTSNSLSVDSFSNPILPDIDDLDDSTEYSQDDYDAISRLDLIYYEHSGGIVYTDSFDNTTGGIIYNLEDWVVSDSGEAFGLTKYGDSVYISIPGKLVMGAQTASLV